MGKRDARQHRRSDRRAHAWNHVERDANLGQCQGLLAAATEHEWVAALEANDPKAPPRGANHQSVDRLLVYGLPAGTFADKEPSRLWRQLQHVLTNQRVREAPHRLERD